MRRALASSVLSILLTATLLWGGCISCDQYFTFGKAHGCCAADGHCKTKAPVKNSSRRDCKLIAFDHHKTIDFHFDLPRVAVQRIAFPLPAIGYLPRSRDAAPGEPSPPDLQILHSVFLI